MAQKYIVTFQAIIESWSIWLVMRMVGGIPVKVVGQEGQVECKHIGQLLIQSMFWIRSSIIWT